MNGTAANVILAIAGFLALMSGVLAMMVGTSAVHQILTAIYFLIFTVAVAGAGIMGAIKRRN